ncbi:MAG: hypothetical protein SGI74_12465 [Oligoflexia bacterium]|nr:hypothetical protein [Oligoflexia bacterium]
MSFVLGFFSCFFALTLAFAAEDIIQLNSEGSSPSEVPAKAQADALKDALNKGSIQVITGLIGESKLEKNMPLIRSKILVQTQKFIQFYKAADAVKKNNDTVVYVNMKISVSSLRDLLAAEGMLYQSEGPATVLPLIKISERRDGARQFRWWMEEANSTNTFLRDQTRLFIAQFESVFRAKNFYIVDPVTQHYVQWMPEPYMRDPVSINDILWMGDFFKAQMVIQGDAVLEPLDGNVVKATIKLVAYHTSNGRVVGEISRSFESTPGEWELVSQQLLRKAFGEVIRDLSTQVFEEWTRGTFGASLLKLSLKGSMNYQDLENFKKQMATKITDIKKIIERKLEKGQATFEVDASGGIAGLVKRLENTAFDGFKLSVTGIENDEVLLRWSKVAGR